MNAVSSCFPLSDNSWCTFLHRRELPFFYPYVTQILKQKYSFKDLFITHGLGNLQRFVKFLLNSQKYQIPKLKKKEDDNYATSFSHTPLSFLGGRKREDLGNNFEMYVLHSSFSPALIFIGLVQTFIKFHSMINRSVKR